MLDHLRSEEMEIKAKKYDKKKSCDIHMMRDRTRFKQNSHVENQAVMTRVIRVVNRIIEVGTSLSSVWVVSDVIIVARLSPILVATA